MLLRSYKDLIVWQKSMELVNEVYLLTHQLPKYELHGLTNQLRRAVVSIPSNIAEGQQRRGTKEFIQFLRIADGSTAEVETQLMIAKDLYALKNADHAFALLDEVRRMLTTLLHRLENN